MTGCIHDSLYPCYPGCSNKECSFYREDTDDIEEITSNEDNDNE